MKIEDAVNMAELTTNFMRTDAKIKGIELDEQTLRLIEVMETLSRYAKKQITKSILPEGLQ